MKIIVVKDRAIDAYGLPMFVRANGEAIRSFTDEINREDSTMGAHPEDYDIYEIGQYDDRTAQITTEPIAKLLLRGQDVKGGKPPPLA